MMIKRQGSSKRVLQAVVEKLNFISPAMMNEGRKSQEMKSKE